MRTRFLVAALLAVTTPVPVLAQDVGDSGIAEATAMLENPDTQEQAGLMAAALVGALLEMPVGQLAEALGEMDGTNTVVVDRDARVRDLLGEGVNGAPQKVAERLPQVMEAMAGMAGALEQMMPALRDMAARLPQDLPATE